MATSTTDMTASKASEQRLQELENERNAICDVFHIGSAARDPQTLMMNVLNSSRRSSCLSMVEHAVSRIKEEDGEEIEECPLNWGDDPLQYRETFKALRDQLRARAEKAEARAAEAERDLEQGFMQGAYARLKNLQEAERKLAAAELDAGRYQVLRNPAQMHGITVEKWTFPRKHLHSEELDAEIDALHRSAP